MSAKVASSGDSHARFPTTSWSLIRNLQQLSAQKRRELFNDWLRQYWKPLYAYFRSKRQTHEQSADLVQAFLLRFLAGDKILQADKPDKRFRDWLLVSARHFLIDEIRKRKTGAAKPDRGIVSFEALREQDGDAYDPPAEESPETAFLEAWRRDLVERAMKTVAEECQGRGRSLDYQIFCEYYAADGAEERSWEELARRHGLANWRKAVYKAEWVKERLARAIRREIRRYVDKDEDVDDEIGELLQ